MKFPAPVIYNDVRYTDFELQRVPAYVLADTKKKIDSTGNSYSGMKPFLAGCISRIYNEDTEVNDLVGIKSIIGKMPLRCAEYAVIQGSLLFSEDDGVEGCYICPRCEHKVIKEKKTLDGEDTDNRDFVSNLEFNITDESSKTFYFSEPIRIINLSNNQVIGEIDEMTMTLPTLDQTIAVMDEYGKKDSIRLQFAQYAKAITHINGEEVDSKWRAQWGLYIFEQIRSITKDLKQISDWILSIGLQTKVLRYCPECGKEWKAYIDVTNFFVSGLQ